MKALCLKALTRCTPYSSGAMQLSRPKVIDISGGEIRPRIITEDAATLLQSTTDEISSAKFVGRGEHAKVQQMLAEVEWTMKTAMEQAELAQNLSTLSVDPRLVELIVPREDGAHEETATNATA